MEGGLGGKTFNAAWKRVIAEVLVKQKGERDA